MTTPTALTDPQVGFGAFPGPLPPGVPVNEVERLLYWRDPLNFLRYCAWTHDPASQHEPIKRFPIDKPYVLPLVRLWQTSPLFIVDKSRRMVVSWTMVLLHLHYAFTNIQRLVGFFSKKQEDADELIERALFAYKQIPEHLYPAKLRPAPERRENRLDFPEIGSSIKAFPQGADQARQHGFSRILFDEFGFWPEAEETYGASYHTIQGGGMLTIVSTHPKLYAGGDPFYRRLLEDRLDAAKTPRPVLYTPPTRLVEEP